MRKKIKLQEILEYIVAACIVINCNTIWDRIVLGKINLIILIISLSGLTYISIKNLIKNRRIFLKTLILIISIIISEFVFIYFNNENIKLFLIKFLLILIPFIVYSVYLFKNNNFSKLLIKISNIIIGLSIISLVFYMLASCLNIMSPSGYVTLEWGYTRTVPTYYHMYYNTQWLYFNGVKVFRNTGVFTEAPMYSFNLCIALMIQLFLVKKQNNKKIYLLLITIFSTLSTTGITIGFGLFVIKILFSKSKKRIYSSIKILLFPIIFILFINVSTYFIVDKINQSAYKYGSFAARIDDFNVGIESWMNNKIFGHGFDRHDITQRYMNRNVREGDMGGASGLMMVLPQGGIYLLSLYIIPLILALIFAIKRRKFNVGIVSIAVMILFIFTNIPYSFMMLYFLAAGWTCLFKCNFIQNI